MEDVFLMLFHFSSTPPILCFKYITHNCYRWLCLFLYTGDMIVAGDNENTKSLFYDYEKCVVTTTTPCITIPKYNFVCLNDTGKSIILHY